MPFFACRGTEHLLCVYMNNDSVLPKGVNNKEEVNKYDSTENLLFHLNGL